MDFDSFIISILFDVNKTKESAKKIENVVEGLKTTILGALASIASIDFFKNIVEGTVQLSTKLDNLSYVTNINKNDLLSWGEAVKRTGGTTEGFYSSITSLSNKIMEMQTNYGTAGQLVFARLGISLKDSSGHIKNAVEILKEFGDKISNLPKTWQLNLGRQLGLDDQTIRLISQGGAQAQQLIDKMYKYSQVNQLNIDKNLQLRNTLYDIKTQFDGIKLQLESQLLPLLITFGKELVKGFEFLENHAELTKVALTALSIFMAGTLVISIFGVTKALIGMTAAMATNPIFLAISAIALLAIGIAGLKQDFDDANGSISDFLKITLGSTAFNKLKEWGKDIRDIFSPVINFFKGLPGFTTDFNGRIEEGKKIFDEANIRSTIKDYATKLGLNPEFAVAIAQKESGLNPNAKSSSSSASGLFQLTDATARENGINNLSNKNDITENVKAGILNLKKITDGLDIFLHRLPTQAESYLGEMLGLSGAEKVLSSKKNTMLSDILSREVIKANPQFKNMTSGQLINNANKTFTQKSVTIGNVKINAPNSNAADIATNIRGELNKHLSMFVTNIDNGVRA